MIGAKLPVATQQELIEVFALRNGIKITHAVMATVGHAIESCLSLRTAEPTSIWCAPIVTADLLTAAELIDLGVPVFYCGSERVVVQRCASRVESAKPIQVQPKVAGVGSVINLVGRGEPIEPIPAGRVTFAEPTKTAAAKKQKPGRGPNLPKSQLYPRRDENGDLWVTPTKRLTKRFIFLYENVARHVARFTDNGMTMDAISKKLGHGGFDVSATTVWVIQQALKAGAWPELK